MALCYHLTFKGGVGFVMILAAQICLSSRLTHRAQWQLWRWQKSSALPALFIFSCSRGGGVGQLKWCILVNICWPRISCWQTCRQADTEASLLGCQGCDTADTSPHGSWLPQLLLGKLVSRWRGSLRTLGQMPSLLLPRPLPSGGLKMFPVPRAYTGDHRARLCFHLSPTNSSISTLTPLQEWCKLSVRFEEESPEWHQQSSLYTEKKGVLLLL